MAGARSGKTFESVTPYPGRVWVTASEAEGEGVDAAVRAVGGNLVEISFGMILGRIPSNAYEMPDRRNSLPVKPRRTRWRSVM